MQKKVAADNDTACPLRSSHLSRIQDRGRCGHSVIYLIPRVAYPSEIIVQRLITLNKMVCSKISVVLLVFFNPEITRFTTGASFFPPSSFGTVMSAFPGFAQNSNPFYPSFDLNSNAAIARFAESSVPALDAVAESSIPGYSAFKSVAQEAVDTAKVFTSPVEQVAVGTLSKVCEPFKSIIGYSYDNVVDKGKEPDVENLKIEMKTSRGLTTHPISNAYRTVLNAKVFDANKKNVLYIHGFTDDPTGNSFTNISDAFSQRNDFNILALDGSSLINWFYLRATTYVRFMGEKLGMVIAEMVRSGVPREDILIVGHSLGSHIAGFTGKMFKNLTGQKLARISSLDPAGPCFAKIDEDLRLSKDDADFVDVIHSNAGVLGLKEQVGHVDFYPNGGTSQPGCVLPGCEHSRSWELYAESVVNPNAFPAKKCKDWKTFVINKCGNSDVNFLGIAANPSKRGIFYLRTNETFPYELRDKGLEGPDGSFTIAQELANHETQKVVDAIV